MSIGGDNCEQIPLPANKVGCCSPAVRRTVFAAGSAEWPVARRPSARALATWQAGRCAVLLSCGRTARSCPLHGFHSPRLRTARSAAASRAGILPQTVLPADCLQRAPSLQRLPRVCVASCSLRPAGWPNKDTRPVERPRGKSRGAHGRAAALRRSPLGQRLVAAWRSRHHGCTSERQPPLTIKQILHRFGRIHSMSLAASIDAPCPPPAQRRGRPPATAAQGGVLRARPALWRHRRLSLGCRPGRCSRPRSSSWCSTCAALGAPSSPSSPSARLRQPPPLPAPPASLAGASLPLGPLPPPKRHVWSCSQSALAPPSSSGAQGQTLGAHPQDGAPVGLPPWRVSDPWGLLVILSCEPVRRLGITSDTGSTWPCPVGEQLTQAK